MSDAELLHDYASNNSEAAFRQLVERHLPLVYSAALRQVGDPALSQDVAQVVFITLARKADRLSSGTILAGWLFRTTRYIAARLMRTEQRRRHREREAFEMYRAQPDDIWGQLAPHLDDALARLGELERNAVLLHYFQNKRLREVGLALGLTEDAAEKRVSRAVEKLRRFLEKRRVFLPAVFIPGLLMTHGAQAAPACVAGGVLSAALGHSALSTPVVVLLKDALRESPWPKIGAALAGSAAVFLAAGLAVHFWPKQQVHGSPGFTVDSSLFPQPRRIPRAVVGSSVPARSPTSAAAAPLGSVALPWQVATLPPTPAQPTNSPAPLLEITNTIIVEAPLLTPATPAWNRPLAAPAGSSQVGGPVVWNTAPSGLRMQPVFYPGGYRFSLAQTSAPARLQPAWNRRGPWMPVQRAAPPVPAQGGSPSRTKRLQ